MSDLTWTEVRRMADELELQIHLAGMEARNHWKQLQPRLAEVEQAIARSGEHLDQMIGEKVSKLGAALRKLAKDIGKA